MPAKNEKNTLGAPPKKLVERLGYDSTSRTAANAQMAIRTAGRERRRNATQIRFTASSKNRDQAGRLSGNWWPSNDGGTSIGRNRIANGTDARTSRKDHCSWPCAMRAASASSFRKDPKA